jgi:VanZ family protein
VVLVSLYVLFSPTQSGPELFRHADKLVHATLFLALAVTAGWRFGLRWGVLALVAAYAPSSELVQAWALPDRSGDWHDVVADLSGVLVGGLLLARVRPVRSRSAGSPGSAGSAGSADLSDGPGRAAGRPARGRPPWPARNDRRR